MTLRNISATRELNLLHMSFLRREGLNKGFYCPITSIPLQNTLIPTVIGSVTYMNWPHYHLNLLTFRSISKEREREKRTKVTRNKRFSDGTLHSLHSRIKFVLICTSLLILSFRETPRIALLIAQLMYILVLIV